MKNLFILLIVALLSVNTEAQQSIIPVEQFSHYAIDNIHIPDGTYFKDVNHLLDKYVGTWTGVFDNKTYQIEIDRHTDHFLGIKVDELTMRYKITSFDGRITVNTLLLPIESVYIINGDYLSKSGDYYLLTYIGYEAKCGQMGEIYINMANKSNTKMELILSPGTEFIIKNECPDGAAKQVFPIAGKGILELEKQ